MKATYFLALVALFAASASACGQHGVDGSKIQNQEANGNNAKGASSDGSVVGLPGVAQGGVNVLSSESNDFDVTQTQQQ
ncbi:hypothetical protein BJV82DRAFT_713183 [Fennellomyces sp. T-0311]|nr:hypothetical protein BJV82DRAFT_713183 [Fennellomyces sp. T-0311]